MTACYFVRTALSPIGVIAVLSMDTEFDHVLVLHMLLTASFFMRNIDNKVIFEWDQTFSFFYVAILL